MVKGGLFCLVFADGGAVCLGGGLGLAFPVIHFVVIGKNGPIHSVDFVIVFLIPGIKLHIVHLAAVIIIEFHAQAGHIGFGDARMVKGGFFRICLTDEGVCRTGGLGGDFHAVPCGRCGLLRGGLCYVKRSVLGTGSQILLGSGDGLRFRDGCLSVGAGGKGKGSQKQGRGTCIESLFHI